MNSVKYKLNAAIFFLALLAAANFGLAYQVYADHQEKQQVSMTYEEVVKATAYDCCN